MKAKNILLAKKLTDIPNIGIAVSKDLESIGVKKPLDLKGKNAFKLYDVLCKKQGVKIDPCMLDTLMAAVDFANGGEPRKWWKYTTERKRILSQN